MANTVVYIDPTAAAGGNGSIELPLRSWLEVNWQAGVTYLQKAGTVFAGSFDVSADGSATSPIVMGTYGSGDAPVINGSVVFDGAQYVTLTGLTLQNSSHAAIAITNGSHNITVSDSYINNNAAGIWFSSTAGHDNRIVDNLISDNRQNGISFEGTPGQAGQENIIAGNTVQLNGWHGIDVYANNVVVENNIVFANGGVIAGASGIHVHANSLAQGLGQNNVIRGNVAYGNLDRGGDDGIGILLDHYTGNNLVENNLAFANDGVGIGVYASFENVIRGNTMFGNVLDRSNTHTLHSEFAINTNAALGRGLSHGNVVEGNVALAYDTNNVAVFVDAESAIGETTSQGNIWQNPLGGNVYIWGQSAGRSETQWNALNGGASDHFSGVPLASAPVGSLEHLFQSDFGLPFDGRVAAIIGWDNSVGLIRNIENVQGGSGNDTLVGDGLANSCAAWAATTS